MKKTATDVLIHIAGPYAKDTGQSCIVCGYLLTPAVGWENEDPTKWEESHLILVDGSHQFDLSCMDEGESESLEARRCKNFDDDDDEDDVAWQ